ncbi:TetR/AcrR family transcriptional regulator [Patulibacter defluvii]|uniref:TetR/AcrR family transcriptional regulator n=1 Tax=Patulibacter defluvii TaxID=3095358 RepID=UPI002A74C292|nr:TetR/AcrR family transcriptional regulator [Patulibacter sp. DM4]
MAGTRSYAGRSAEERQATRRRQLLDAGFALLGEQGWTSTTVRGVCQRAGLTPRFFYESFGSLDALAVAVYDEIVEQATGGLAAAVAAAGDDRAAKATAAITALLDALTEDPRRARIVFVEALGSEALTRRRMATMGELAEIIAGYGRAEYGATPEAESLVRITAALLAGGVAELLLAWLDGSLGVDRETLIAEGAELVVEIGDGAHRIARARRP